MSADDNKTMKHYLDAELAWARNQVTSVLLRVQTLGSSESAHERFF